MNDLPSRFAYWRRNLLYVQVLLVVWFVVSLGFGVALLPSSLRAINRKGVVFRPVSPATLKAEMAAAHRKDDGSMVLAEFMGVVDDELRAPV